MPAYILKQPEVVFLSLLPSLSPIMTAFLFLGGGGGGGWYLGMRNGVDRLISFIGEDLHPLMNNLEVVMVLQTTCYSRGWSTF